MSLARTIAFVIALCLIAAFPQAAPAGFTWMTVDYPGNVTTQLHGISGGKILGTWYDFPNNKSGHFLYESGSVTDLNHAPPDAAGSTVPWKIDGVTQSSAGTSMRRPIREHSVTAARRTKRSCCLPVNRRKHSMCPAMLLSE